MFALGSGQHFGAAKTIAHEWQAKSCYRTAGSCSQLISSGVTETKYLLWSDRGYRKKAETGTGVSDLGHVREADSGSGQAAEPALPVQELGWVQPEQALYPAGPTGCCSRRALT